MNDQSILHQGKSKGKRPAGVNQEQIDKGIRVEHEHTDDPRVARKIVYDHLSEGDPQYYDHLDEMEKKYAVKGFLFKVASLLKAMFQTAPAHSIVAGQSVEVPGETKAKSGNYKKGHIKLHGMDISIENPIGSFRQGKGRDGKVWKNEMKADYGYIKGTVGHDKDHLDVFIKPHYAGDEKWVHVVNQVDPQTRKFDEHKVMIGYSTNLEAIEGYKSNYSPGWNGFGYVTVIPIDVFKNWAYDAKNGPRKGELTPEDVVRRGLEMNIPIIKAYITQQAHVAHRGGKLVPIRESRQFHRLDAARPIQAGDRIQANIPTDMLHDASKDKALPSETHDRINGELTQHARNQFPLLAAMDQEEVRNSLKPMLAEKRYELIDKEFRAIHPESYRVTAKVQDITITPEGTRSVNFSHEGKRYSLPETSIEKVTPPKTTEIPADTKVVTGPEAGPIKEMVRSKITALREEQERHDEAKERKFIELREGQLSPADKLVIDAMNGPAARWSDRFWTKTFTFMRGAMDKDEARSETYIALLEASKTWREGEGKLFSSWAHPYVMRRLRSIMLRYANAVDISQQDYLRAKKLASDAAKETYLGEDQVKTIDRNTSDLFTAEVGGDLSKLSNSFRKRRMEEIRQGLIDNAFAAEREKYGQLPTYTEAEGTEGEFDTNAKKTALRNRNLSAYVTTLLRESGSLLSQELSKVLTLPETLALKLRAVGYEYTDIGAVLAHYNATGVIPDVTPGYDPVTKGPQTKNAISIPPNLYLRNEIARAEQEIKKFDVSKLTSDERTVYDLMRAPDGSLRSGREIERLAPLSLRQVQKHLKTINDMVGMTEGESGKTFDLGKFHYEKAIEKINSSKRYDSIKGIARDYLEEIGYANRE